MTAGTFSNRCTPDNTAMIVGIVVPLAVLAVLLIAAYFLRRHFRTFAQAREARVREGLRKEKRVDEAVGDLTKLTFPLCVTTLRNFKGLSSLPRHEHLRATGKLQVSVLLVPAFHLSSLGSRPFELP